MVLGESRGKEKIKIINCGFILVMSLLRYV